MHNALIYKLNIEQLYNYRSTATTQQYFMKGFAKLFLSAVALLTGCESTGVDGGYHDLGVFSSRVQAQNIAIADILRNYGSLPTNGYYKVKYANNNALPNEHRENALWYSKGESTLRLEVDVNSGSVCSWQEVSRSVLEQAVKSTDSMNKIDSLAKPNQPYAQCLK